MASQSGRSSGVRRLIISEILIVVLLLISFAAFKILSAQKPTVQQKEIVATQLNVNVFTSEPLDFQELLTGFGTARADREVIVAAQVSGEIVDIHPQLKIGQAVEAGKTITPLDGPSMVRDADQLLKIDARELQQRVDQATNSIGEATDEISRLTVQKTNLDRQLAKARSVLETLQEELARAKTAEGRLVGTKAELNKALLEVQRYEDNLIQLENQVASLPLQISSAQKRLSSSKTDQQRALNDLARTEVYPPFDGVLSEVFVERGRFVRAGDQLVKLTDPSVVEIPVSLAFEDYLQLQEILRTGATPSVSIAENETAETRWKGRLVRASPQADSRSRTVEVYVEVTNSEDTAPLLPGTFVYAKIDGRVYRNQMLIPREAVVDGAVYVVDESKIARRRKVTLGRRFQSLVVVTEGIQEGDQLVLTNLDIVQDGKEVVIQSESDPAKELAAVRSPLIVLLSPQQ